MGKGYLAQVTGGGGSGGGAVGVARWWDEFMGSISMPPLVVSVPPLPLVDSNQAAFQKGGFGEKNWSLYSIDETNNAPGFGYAELVRSGDDVNGFTKRHPGVLALREGADGSPGDATTLFLGGGVGITGRAQIGNVFNPAYGDWIYAFGIKLGENDFEWNPENSSALWGFGKDSPPLAQTAFGVGFVEGTYGMFFCVPNDAELTEINSWYGTAFPSGNVLMFNAFHPTMPYNIEIIDTGVVAADPTAAVPTPWLWYLCWMVEGDNKFYFRAFDDQRPAVALSSVQYSELDLSLFHEDDPSFGGVYYTLGPIIARCGLAGALLVDAVGCDPDEAFGRLELPGFSTAGAADGIPGPAGPALTLDEIDLAPGSPGNFDVAHALGSTPTIVGIKMTSDGAIWAQTPEADGTNLKLTASSGGITGKAVVSVPAPPQTTYEIDLAPGAGGNFTAAHGLAGIPQVLGIKMTSDGAIWTQTPEADGTDLKLTASSGGITGKAVVRL